MSAHIHVFVTPTSKLLFQPNHSRQMAAHPESGSAQRFFLLKGRFSFPLSVSACSWGDCQVSADLWGACCGLDLHYIKERCVMIWSYISDYLIELPASHLLSFVNWWLLVLEKKFQPNSENNLQIILLCDT